MPDSGKNSEVSAPFSPQCAEQAPQEDLFEQISERVQLLKEKLDQACVPPPAAAAGSNPLGARKDACFKAICTAPSINWTPAGSGQVPVPYQTIQDLSNSVSAARTVNFNGTPAYLLDQTKQPKGTGDERGTRKGIRSGTVTGEVTPVSGCSTVRIEGKLVVRHGDKCTMNGGNNPGIYIANATASGAASAAKDSSLTLAPPVSTFQIADLLQAPKLNRLSAEVQKLEPGTLTAAEKQMAKTRNSLGIALLGYHGGPGALARISGASEEGVESANMIGAATLGLEATVAPTLQGQRPLIASPTSRGTGLRVHDSPDNGTGLRGKTAEAIDSLANGESRIVLMNPRNLISQQSADQMTGSAIKRLEKSMKMNGFDVNEPISGVVRSDGRVVISDGHHRVQAAIRVGITEVPVDIYKP